MEMEKYYPDIDDHGKCKEKCAVVDSMIGSVFCQNCKHCIEYDKTYHKWIMCDILDKAKGLT